MRTASQTLRPPQGWAYDIGAFLDDLRAAGRPATTIELRRYQLTRVARALDGDPWSVTREQLVAWIAGHDRWSAETRRSWRAALRAFWAWGIDSGRTSHNPAGRLPRVRPSTPRPHPTPDDAWRLALAGADRRTRLMLRLAGELGMRRGEVAVVHRRDLLHTPAGWSLLVHGKGGKPRVLPVSDDLAHVTQTACERGGGYAFPGAISGHLSPARVGRIVSHALPEGWTMHSLRHRFGTRAYAVDRDLLTVQKLLGHASPVTTRIYVEVDDDALRRTVLAAA